MGNPAIDLPEGLRAIGALPPFVNMNNEQELPCILGGGGGGKDRLCRTELPGGSTRNAQRNGILALPLHQLPHRAL